MAADLGDEFEVSQVFLGYRSRRDVCAAIAPRLMGFTPTAIETGFHAWYLVQILDRDKPMKKGLARRAPGAGKDYDDPAGRVWSHWWMDHIVRPTVEDCRAVYDIVDQPAMVETFAECDRRSTQTPERWLGEIDIALGRDSDFSRFALELRETLPEPTH